MYHLPQINFMAWHLSKTKKTKTIEFYQGSRGAGTRGERDESFVFSKQIIFWHLNFFILELVIVL